MAYTPDITLLSQNVTAHITHHGVINLYINLHPIHHFTISKSCCHHRKAYLTCWLKCVVTRKHPGTFEDQGSNKTPRIWFNVINHNRDVNWPSLWSSGTSSSNIYDIVRMHRYQTFIILIYHVSLLYCLGEGIKLPGIYIIAYLNATAFINMFSCFLLISSNHNSLCRLNVLDITILCGYEWNKRYYPYHN